MPDFKLHYMGVIAPVVGKVTVTPLQSYIPSKQLTSTVTYMFDSGNANIEKIVAPLIFELAMCFKNNIILKKFLVFI